MRVLGLLVACTATAVAGGAVALLVGTGTGWIGGETTFVTNLTTTAPPAPAPSPPSALPRGAFDAAALYRSRVTGVVTIYAQIGGRELQGSGFVVDRRGTILTNAHVITDVADNPGSPVQADALYVEFADRDRAPARTIGWDPFSDVGVIRVSPADHALTPVPLGDSSAVVVGTPVAAIGSPFGNQSSLSVGVVAATGRQIDSLTSSYSVADAIQIDAPINRGNSGGPLFDGSGRVIGINAQIRSQSGTAEGVGFAIPINIARRALSDIERTGRASYAYIGIETQDVTPSVARELGLAEERGAIIASVQPDTPAARAGLRGATSSRVLNGQELAVGGDIVLAIAGFRVDAAEDVSRIVTEKVRPGDTVSFTLLRDGSQRIRLKVTLAERPPNPR